MIVTKQRLALLPNKSGVHQTFVDSPDTPVRLNVVDAATGPVSTLDKVKGYYKGLITLVGSLLIIANEATPLLNFLPANDKQYVTYGIAILTTAAAFLKGNEHWVDDL